jgi:hypothetical protein
MTDDISTYRSRCYLGAVFSLCALTGVTLLANHPGSSAHGVVAVINDEVAHRVVDGVVHGGFIVTLVALIICFMLLSRILGSSRAPVVIGLACFCTGCGALIASLVLDGLVTPAIAVRLAGADDLQSAKTIFTLIGTLVGFLMPMGLLFQFAAMLSWSTVIMEGRGARRAVGTFGLVVALSLIVATFALPVAMAAHVIFAGIILESIWYFAIAALLFNRSSWPGADGSKPT